MTNDIASELSLLHMLKGAAYVSKLMEIAARKEFNPLEDDPCIFSVGGEKDADYPNLLNAARKAVEQIVTGASGYGCLISCQFAIFLNTRCVLNL